MTLIKKLDEGLPDPKRAHAFDAGIDLYAREGRTLRGGERYTMPLGVAVDVPAGYVGLLCVRSGNAAKRGLGMVNGVGVIDAGYHGEVCATLLATGGGCRIERGERIAQLLVVPCVRDHVLLVRDLGESERGENGFGSTGTR